MRPWGGRARGLREAGRAGIRGVFMPTGRFIGAGAWRAGAVLTLAPMGEDEAALDVVRAPVRKPGLLCGPTDGDDPAAVVACAAARAQAGAATAMFFLAVASAVGGDRERAGHTLGRARKADPGRSGEWISV